MDARIIARRLVYDRWSRFEDVQVRLPNGAVETRIIEDHGDAAAVFLYDPDRRTALLIRQPRMPVIDCGAPPLLEVVAGRLDGETAEATARREAEEEAGVVVRSCEAVATLWSMPSISTEQVYLYLAEYRAADRVGAGGGAADENECIEVVELPLAEVWAMAVAGDLADGKTFTLLQALRLRRPDLFD